ncbi:STAS domain-containing protein [Streptomyces sp. NPDC048304]|uniref:STAS domain-containing protein n=1 Tax=Streptomyces sp. NPDC048304 TaxID=3154820 RepID=UPI00340C767D
MGEPEGHKERALSQFNGRTTPSTAAVQYELNGTWVIVAQGEYDMKSLEPLAEALEAAAQKHPKVVLVASEVTFADSTFLNLLLRIRLRTHLCLVAPAPQLQRVLEITEAVSVLDVRDSVQDATTD